MALKINIGDYRHLLDAVLVELEKDRIVDRIWSGDYTVWGSEPAEISNRLGWLNSPQAMSGRIDGLRQLAFELREENYTHALLLGMGGSSLAPEVLRKTFGFSEGYLDLAVLDSTDPGALLYHADRLDPARTLFIVATKSGATTETISFLKYFYKWMSDKLAAEAVGDHFIAITDPGSPLAELADQYSFRASYLNDPDIGGRYSALSYFGLLPAVLMGVDAGSLLNHSFDMVESCRKTGLSVEDGNPGVILGAVMGMLAEADLDKLTIVTSPRIASFGNWVEQLVAESTGKNGKGILPVLEELPGAPSAYGDDRAFVYLKTKGDNAHDTAMEAIERAGHPVVKLYLDDLYDLGGQFFLWEMATAVACHLLKVNPFDQPDVESAKSLTRKTMVEYTEIGVLPHEVPALTSGETAVYGNVKADSPEETLAVFLSQARPGDYVAIQAYLQPTEETDRALSELRTKIRDRYGFATTAGYGPRYLHSTGQLHKGDTGRGLFIQLTADDARDALIPDEIGSGTSSVTFSVLKRAQAMGDRKALLDAGRRVIRFHLGAGAPKLPFQT
ncbi:MAG: glucose-6-phosphate isomerase [Deltaproteobacteria bacterium]|nr:glucose-6-phosphate isomerase [Deltaproteobacteria bacterium]MBW2596194.1 glucose-6-phosphate isomerase [Deltaproteobacteria bacterium]MBW2649741.1 glucose-6-phosphate isomerase [Deltaproteobacteria bacterium]